MAGSLAIGTEIKPFSQYWQWPTPRATACLPASGRDTNPRWPLPLPLPGCRARSLLDLRPPSPRRPPPPPPCLGASQQAPTSTTRRFRQLPSPADPATTTATTDRPSDFEPDTHRQLVGAAAPRGALCRRRQPRAVPATGWPSLPPRRCSSSPPRATTSAVTLPPRAMC